MDRIIDVSRCCAPHRSSRPRCYADLAHCGIPYRGNTPVVPDCIAREGIYTEPKGLIRVSLNLQTSTPTQVTAGDLHTFSQPSNQYSAFALATPRVSLYTLCILPNSSVVAALQSPWPTTANLIRQFDPSSSRHNASGWITVPLRAP